MGSLDSLRRVCITLRALRDVSASPEHNAGGARRGMPLQSVGDEHYPTINHVPFREREVVDVFGDEAVFREAEGLKHGLLPVTTAAFDAGDGIDDAQGEDAFDRTGDKAEGESLGVVLVPRLDVEGQGRYSALQPEVQPKDRLYAQPNRVRTVFQS